MAKTDLDVAIIGSGPAGVAAAKMLAGMGKQVAVIEEGAWGGNEINRRDLPFKAAACFSHLYGNAIYGERYGISSKTLKFNYPSVQHFIQKAVTEKSQKIQADLEQSRVRCIKGRAHLTSSTEISVGKDSKVSAKKILIATGAEWKDPGIAGTATAKFYKPDEAIFMKRVPKTVMIVGGGATGVELAQYFSEMGSRVAIAEISERLLPREDAEAGNTLQQFLEKRFDVKVLTSTRVIALEENAVTKRVLFLNGGAEKMVQVEEVILATGSKPATDIGLENAKVKFNQKGIQVDRTLRTNVRNIYAAGDAIEGEISSVEVAECLGGLAAGNMYGGKNYVNYDGFMRVVETDPQVAVIGLTEDDLTKRGKKYKSAVVTLDEVVISGAMDFRMGFVKLITDRKGVILGAQAVCPNAADILQEVAVMMRHGFPVIELASAPHAGMGWGEAVRRAARKSL